FTEQGLRRRIGKNDIAAPVETDDAFTDGLEQQLIVMLETLHFLQGATQGSVGIAEFAAATIQLEKHAYLALQHFRNDRLGQKVHRTAGIAVQHVFHVAVDRGNKNDRHGAGARLFLHLPRHFVAVHAGHLHVEQHYGAVVLREQVEGFTARGGLQQFNVKVVKQGFQRNAVGRLVVNHQYGGFAGHAFVSPRRAKWARYHYYPLALRYTVSAIIRT